MLLFESTELISGTDPACTSNMLDHKLGIKSCMFINFILTIIMCTCWFAACIKNLPCVHRERTWILFSFEKLMII